MTLAMPDSVTPGNIPMGFPAYLGYVDGLFKTAPRLPQLFPGAKVIALTVLGSTLSADGIDCEPGNMSAHRAAVWVHDKLEADPGSRPVVYADLESPGFSMSEILAGLAALGIARACVRVLTAHYDGEHVCSPARGCRDKDGQVIAWTADGTQWTDQFAGIGGAAIDMSLLADDFFAAPAPAPAANWAFGPVRDLRVVNAGQHSVALSWTAPGVFDGVPPSPAPGIGCYEVAVMRGGQAAAAYPRYVPKGTNPEAWSGGSLSPGTAYEAWVRAMMADGGHSSPWAKVPFETPG